jgi:hypothetical protein
MASGPEWDQRQLCPDGSCVGVIGDDGTCRVCGRAMPGWGDERQRGLFPPEDSGEGEDPGDEHGDEDDGDEDAGDDVAADSPDPGAGGWDDRQLCPDGSCVGVIGDDGQCTVCGKSATAQAS